MQDIWNKVETLYLYFLQLKPQTAVYGFLSFDNETFLIQNNLSLSLKLHIYNTRKYWFLSFNDFRNETKRKNFRKKNNCKLYMWKI